MAAPNFNDWANSVVGKFIDMDNAYGAQCWDLVAHWLASCGVPLALTYTSPNPPYAGLAGSLVQNFPARNGIQNYVNRIGPLGPFQAGDVLVWGSSPNFPDTHTAVAAGPAANGVIPVITQNDGSAASASGATRRGSLTTAGLIGALRPRNIATNVTGGLPMYATYWTGPTPNNTRVSGRMITDYGTFWVPTMQLMNLLTRRHDAALKAGDLNDQMLDAEHDIMNAFLRTCWRSAQTGVDLDPAKLRSALTDALKALGKDITVNMDTEINPEDLAKAFDQAAPRIASAMVKQAGTAMAK